MKTISLNKTKFQTFLETLTFVFHLFFGEFPIEKTEPYKFVSPVSQDRIALKKAVALFEFKKRGGVR